MPTDPAAQKVVMYRMIDAYFRPEERTVMRRICDCESECQQIEPDGTLLQNNEGGSARGSFQVLMRVHRDEMAEKGLDPNDTHQYMQYVRHLKRQYGTSPWAPSKKCWGPKLG